MKKQKQSSNQLAYLKGKKEKEKKKKEKVHLTNWINQKKTIHEPLALFI